MDTHIYELFTTNLSYVREHSSPKGKPIELKNEKYQSTDEFSRNVGDWIANHVKSIEKLIRTELGENHKLLSINSVDLITDRVLIYLEEFPADAEEINFSSIVTALRPPLLKLQKLASDPSFEVYGTQPLPEEELQEMIKGNTKEKRIYFRLVNNALLKALSQQLRGEKDPQLSKQETSSSLFQNFKFQRAVIKILDDGPAQMQEVSSQQNHNGPNSMISKCQENQQKTRADSLREKYENYQRNEKQSDEKNSNAYTYDVPDPTYLSAYSKSKPKSEPYFKEIDEKTRKAKFFRNRNKTGLIYEGFVNELGQKHGKGRYNYPNGDIYEGQFVNDQCEGEGKLFFKIGGQSECPGGYYEGGFKANKMEGLGKLVNKNGVPIYHGEFKQNVKDGFGRLFLENSDWYVGHFSNNFRHGQGTLFIRKEYALEGNWETNRKHGEFKKYREWIFDREGIPQVKNEKDNEIVYYRQDQLSNTKPSRITFVDSSDSKILGSNTSQRTNRPNREIITRFGIRLTDEDMVTLKGSNPLGANIVNAYMRAIEERYLELFCANVRDLPRILFLDSDFFSQLTLDDLYAKEISYEKVQNALAAHSSNENSAFDLYDRILIAVNKSGSHWVLAEIFCYHSDKGKATDLEFRVYDSMAEERVFDDPRKDPIFRHLQDFALVEMEERFKGKRPQIMAMILKATYKYMQVPRQRDMYNCGVFLCKFIQHLGSGKQKIAFDSSVQEMNALRKEIEKVLLNKCENPLLPSVVDSDQEEENYINYLNHSPPRKMDVKLVPVQCKSEETSADVINVKEEEDILSEENDSKEETAKTPDPKLSGGLLRPSKKISKEKQVERHNADKFVKFFKKWRDLKRTNEDVRQQTKFWFSSFNKKLNKTYIYRDFFDSVRIHFRLAISGKNFNFDKFKDDDWHKLFANLTDFLRNEVYNSESKVDQEKKSQVVPVWIEGIDKFKIEGFPQYSH